MANRFKIGDELQSLVVELKNNFGRNNWQEIIQTANILLSKAILFIEDQKNYKNENNYCTKLPRSIVYYVGFAKMAKGTALEQLGEFDQAIDEIQFYMHLEHVVSEIIELDSDRNEEEIQYFNTIALPNYYVVQLKRGNFNIINEYLAFLEQEEEERLPGISMILEAANKYSYDVDRIIEDFKADFDEIEFYDDPVNMGYTINCKYQLAVYYINRKDIQVGLDYALQSLQLAVKIGNDKGSSSCLFLFENNRDYATDIQLATFKSIIKGVQAYEKEVGNSISIADSFIWIS